jgi:HEAT repeat protein
MARKQNKPKKQPKPEVPAGYTAEEWAEYQADPCGWCIKELRNPDAEVRYNAADILRGLAADAERAIPALVAGFRDPDKEVRTQCVFALVDIAYAVKERAAGAVPALVKSLQDKSAEIRSLAAEAVAAIGPAARPAKARLLKARKDRNAEVRKSVEKALKSIESA